LDIGRSVATSPLRVRVLLKLLAVCAAGMVKVIAQLVTTTDAVMFSTKKLSM
jgi:hypothetical protein